MWMDLGLAVINGLCIAGSRAINGQLGKKRGALAASFWNHLGGCLFLSMILLAGLASLRWPQHAPWQAWMGGMIGAGFVAINSLVLPRLGAMKTTLLVISGQLACGAWLDQLDHRGKSGATLLAGLGLVALGLCLARRPVRARHQTEAGAPSARAAPRKIA
ncbi:DMT family transporter [Chromobacterium sp. IIBBL 290-4]|uniref:DMT family transporter n=1 Tax=Chromobacterium sp. IIBBL 290-4 TaxID=2953890 RepID=UPI0020B7BABD|nr:DMT family transporter [Chromobacterium sp. IIBBL 290-4]UTH72618.1 DMT family transporter [Chromobacterium sp. IIBBL 290-4]